MARPPRLSTAFALAAVLAAAPVVAVQPAPSLVGTWDLTWMTRRGPERSGQMVISQERGELVAQIRGRGSVRARGTSTGSSFNLRGSRMAVPYRINGSWQGDRLEGTIKVLSVERRFTGTRRRR